MIFIALRYCLISFQNLKSIFRIGDGESQSLGYPGIKNPKSAEVFRYEWK